MLTTAEKLQAIERELKTRERQYPGRVMTKRMTKQQADYQLAVMRAIRDDYLELAKKETLL